MQRVFRGVDEVDTRPIGIRIDQKELQQIGGPERFERAFVWNDNGAVAGIDARGRVHRIHAHRISQLSDVVEAIAVHVGGVGDEVFFHPVALQGQRLHILGQRCRALFAQLHQDRQVPLRAVHLVLHIEHEVVVGRGGDHDGHRRHLHFHRRRTIAASLTWLRVAALCKGISAGQKEEGCEDEDSALVPFVGFGRFLGSSKYGHHRSL